VGRFLGPSIDRFWADHSPDGLARAWEAAGLGGVQWERMSLGGGFVIQGVKQ
jgi:hypothetical protein